MLSITVHALGRSVCNQAESSAGAPNQTSEWQEGRIDGEDMGDEQHSDGSIRESGVFSKPLSANMRTFSMPQSRLVPCQLPAAELGLVWI